MNMKIKKSACLLLAAIMVLASAGFAYADQSYTVKPGDVLWKIADDYNTTYQKLAQYNKIENPNRIYPNQIIQIPEGNASDPSAPAPAPAPAPDTAANSNAADTVFTNGYVYTGGADPKTVVAVAVKDGLILFVGNAADAKKYVGAKTKVIDLKGKMLMPSFFETHGHAQSQTSMIYSVSLKGLKSVDEYVKAIKEFSDANPGATAITGFGWLNTMFPPEGPSKELLDKIRSDIPISLTSEDYHSAWVNSKALEMGKVTKDTPNPAGGGVIEHNAKGEPSGTLRESATSLVENIMPDYTVEQYKEGIKAYQEMAQSLGFTGAFDAVLAQGSNAVEAYKELAKSGELEMRIRGVYITDSEQGAEQIAQLTAAKQKDDAGEMFKINTLKFFEDGVVEGLTAYLLEPYAPGTGKPDGYQGEPKWKIDKLKEVVAAGEKAGFQIHIHAIGDGAVRDSLDALAYAEQKNGEKDYRNAITHLQLVAPADIPRFKELGVIAAVNPYWHFKDDYYYNLQLPYLGEPRAEKEYPMKSFIDAGAMIASASDYPVTAPPDPLFGIEVGITRTVPGGNLSYGAVQDPKDPKYKLPLWPEESVSLNDMIASYTYNGAYANFLENKTGSIEVGKSADMIVLDKNLFKIAPTEISKGKVLMTMFQGKEVYKADSFKN
jgi:predicted amidohydrolase YtcJ